MLDKWMDAIHGAGMFQIILLLGFLALIILMLFVEVPKDNIDFVKTGLTAITTLLSGGALGWQARGQQERRKNNEEST